MQKREIVKKPLDWFVLGDNIRKEYDPDYLDRLGNSLLVKQWVPLLAGPAGELYDGTCRLKAAKLKGIEALLVEIIGEPLSQTDKRLVQGITAMHRADLTPFEKYLLCYELLQINPAWELKDLASHLAIAPANVTKIMAASKAEPEVRAALEAGKLSTSDVYFISNEGSRDDQLAALAGRLNGSIANREALIRRGRQKKNGEQPKVSRFKATVSGAAFTVAREGLDMTALIDALGDLLKLVKKGEREGWDLKTLEAVLRDQNK